MTVSLCREKLAFGANLDPTEFAASAPYSRVRMQRTMVLGDVAVPVYQRPWRAGPRQPYRKTYSLKPGDSWLDAAVTNDQWEHYVLLENGEQVPVGAMICRELVDAGASSAYFTEIWGGLVLVGPDLICAKLKGEPERFVSTMRIGLGGSIAGLPDVLGFFPDGRIVFREAKNVAARDRLQPSQHNFARVARTLFGTKVDMAIIEWGF